MTEKFFFTGPVDACDAYGGRWLMSPASTMSPSMERMAREAFCARPAAPLMA